MSVVRKTALLFEERNRLRLVATQMSGLPHLEEPVGSIGRPRLSWQARS